VIENIGVFWDFVSFYKPFIKEWKKALIKRLGEVDGMDR
jgi:hypothetical protein